MTIGEKIKMQRKSLGLTQTELGARLGVQKNAVSKWECGRVDDIPSSKIKAMAQLFGVQPSYLIDDETTVPSPANEAAYLTTGERMRARRKELGLSADDVAAALNVSRATIFRYEKGDIEKVPGNSLAPLEKVLHTNAAYLMGWSNDPSPAEETPTASNITPVDFSHLKRIPILGRIAAGAPIYAEENIEGYTFTDLNGGAEYFALRVRGDSMNAVRIYDGDIVIIRRQDIVENGEIAAVLIDNQDATLKRFSRNGDTVTLIPQSTNPEHQPFVYNLKDTSVKILGLVIKVEFQPR